MNNSNEAHPFDPEPKNFIWQMIDRLSIRQKIKYVMILLALVSVLLPMLMRGAGFNNVEPAWGLALLITSPTLNFGV